MSDYHLHLHRHSNAPDQQVPSSGPYPSGLIDRYVEAALARGVTELGFTEHLYRCIESEAVLGPWWEHDPDPRLAATMADWIRRERTLSLARYVDVVLDAKARGLPVRLGLEVDFVVGTERAVLDLLDGIPFDFLVGSIHWLGAWNFMPAAASADFAPRGLRRSYVEYFAAEAQLAASGLVDVLAHADVIKRHGNRPQGSLAELYQPVVEAAAASGTAVEISSAGLRHVVAEIYPAPEFLRLFHAAGVAITFGSDAHVADDAGWGHDAVIGAARAAGYRDYLRFAARRRLITPLPAAAEEASGRSREAPARPAPG
jgi:histidinol-phosphatase (PHP family)